MHPTGKTGGNAPADRTLECTRPGKRGEMPPPTGPSNRENGGKCPRRQDPRTKNGGKYPRRQDPVNKKRGEMPPPTGPSNKKRGEMPPPTGPSNKKRGQMPPPTGPSNKKRGEMPPATGPSNRENGGKWPRRQCPRTGKTGENAPADRTLEPGFWPLLGAWLRGDFLALFYGLIS
jgi:hypothetical protein